MSEDWAFQFTTRELALEVSCPRCSALAKVPCRNERGFLSGCHKERHLTAIRHGHPSVAAMASTNPEFQRWVDEHEPAERPRELRPHLRSVEEEDEGVG